MRDMVISHVTIIADSALCFNAILGVMGQFFYIINKDIALTRAHIYMDVRNMKFISSVDQVFYE